MKLSRNIFSSWFGLFKIMAMVKIKINEVKLNIILKLFFIKTPNIKIVKIDKDKKISGSNIFKLLIIFYLVFNASW